jgi:cytochrome P450
MPRFNTLAFEHLSPKSEPPCKNKHSLSLFPHPTFCKGDHRCLGAAITRPRGVGSPAHQLICVAVVRPARTSPHFKRMSHAKRCGYRVLDMLDEGI